MDIMAALAPTRDLSQAGKYSEALSSLSDLWATIPDPKEDTKNSYLIVAYGVRISQKSGDLEQAWKWAQRALPYSGSFNLAGESEFLVGEIACARGDEEIARHYFRMVRKNSGKRLFKGKDPKYLELSGG